MKPLKFVCYGEVLWDIFPTHKKIGGAPLNVALRLKSLGNEVSIISKVGNDDQGFSLLDYVQQQGLDTNHIQVDSEMKTGEVLVKVDKNGSASYDILDPSAWDGIEILEDDQEMVANADAFIFGSLIARHDRSKNTLFSLIEAANFKIFDVNLRSPYYTKELLINLMQKADFVKFNDDELLEISALLGSKSQSLEHNMTFISKFSKTKHICVTKGKDGAVLFLNDKFYYSDGFSVEVVDTVGAGDSFLATLIDSILKNQNLQTAIDRACAVGALVAQKEGANPSVSSREIDCLMNPAE